MRYSADLAGQWVVLDAGYRVIASGDTASEAVSKAASKVASAQGADEVSTAWVSPHPPYVALPHWPLVSVAGLAEEELWLAGGPVRDLLMGRAPNDWDFVVPRHGISLARTVANALQGDFYTLDADRGTGRAIVPQPGGERSIVLDFAELRGPTIEEDLRLRDFTINAMALTLTGDLIDPTGGERDLDRAIVRLTHPKSLRHDPVRLVRAIRFVVELGFALAPDTAGQLRTDAAMIRGVAAERVRDELVKVFSGSRAGCGLQLLSDHGLLPHLLPEVAGQGSGMGCGDDAVGDCRDEDCVAEKRRLLDAVGLIIRVLHRDGEPVDDSVVQKDALTALGSVVEDFGSGLDAYLSQSLSAGLSRRDLAPWCALFSADRDNALAGERGAASAEGRLAKLRFSARSQSFVATTVRELWRFSILPAGGLPDDPDARQQVHRYFKATGESGVMVALLSVARVLVVAGSSTQRPDLQKALDRFRQVLTAYFRLHDQLIAPRPLLTGHDLLQMGFPEGPGLGRALASLLEAQAAGRISSEAEARAWLARLTANL